MFGIGDGKIELLLDKHDFNPGDEIRGKAILSVKKPIKAKKLGIKFFGEEKRTKQVYSKEGTRTQTDYVKIYEFDLDLDKEKEYPAASKEYPFKITIPKNILVDVSKPEGTFGKVLNFLSSMSKGNVQWYLEARLDVPWAIDISKKVQIQII